jgi:beta-fructofuranosidase
MAYTGNWFGPRPAVGLASSSDLCRWEKIAANPITAIDEHHYTAKSRGRRRFPHWRDPFLFEVDSIIYQLVCATSAGATGASATGPEGTIGVARSRDMKNWEIMPPLDVEPFAEELECPQVVSGGGRHYLVFSSPEGLLLSDSAAASDAPGNMYCMVGDTPLGPYRVADPHPWFPADMRDRPYAGRVVALNRRHYVLGTIWSDGGDRISDPIPVELTPTGIRPSK